MSADKPIGTNEGEPTTFRFLDKHADIEKTYRNLPHWFQAGSAMFVTFRNNDSMPKDVVMRWHAELEHWVTTNGLPRELAGEPNCPDASQPSLASNHRHKSRFRTLKRSPEATIATSILLDSIPPAKRAEFKKLR